MSLPFLDVGVGIRCGLLGMTMISCYACTTLDYYPTPPDPASRTAKTAVVHSSTGNGCNCTTTFAATNRFKRVLIVVLENRDYADATKDLDLLKLAEKGAQFDDFHGLVHPSYSNYLAMITGRPIESHWDRQQTYDVCSIADLLAANKPKQLRWKNYAQEYPVSQGCFLGDEAAPYGFGKHLYERKHVPFLSIKSIQDDKERCSNVVPATQFEEDRKANALPEYSFYTPDMKNDGHDTDMKTASAWLKSFLEPLLADKTFMSETLIVVTFDESEHDNSPKGENHIYTVFLGGMVVPRRHVPENHNHYNVLRTIEENFGLCALGEGDGGAKPIEGLWN
jgi:hypothetical protein